MKKIYLFLSASVCAFSLNAQVIWTENFTGATGTTPPAGWVNNDINGSEIVWTFSNEGGQTLTAPITDPAAVLDSDFFSDSGTDEDAALESPAFDASAVAGSLVLSFDHFFYQDFTDATWAVEVYNGTVWTVVLSGTETTNDPQAESVDITAAAGGSAVAKVRFHWVGTWDYYWIVDNVTVADVSCLSPFDIAAASVTDNSAITTWTEGGSETTWYVEYGPEGFTPGTGTIDTITTTATDTLTGLDAETAYDVYVQADCGGDGESTWAGPYTFTTTCVYPIISMFPWTENFDAVTAPEMPCGWNAEDINADEITWVVDEYNPFSGANALFLDYNSDEASNDWIYTPELVLEAGTSYRLTFRQRVGSEDYPENLAVAIGASQNSADMVTNLLVLEEMNNETYALRSVDFTVPANGSYHIGFYGYSETDMDGIMLDDITIDFSPSCFEPTGLAYTSDHESADITWTAGASETDWNIEYGPAGFTPGTGTADVATGTPEYTAEGLDALTDYEFYVQSDCGGGDESVWVGPFAFSTTCEPVAVTAYPWTEDFDSEVSPGLPCGWASEDLNGDDIVWNYDNPDNFISDVLYIEYNGNEAMNDWAYTPEFVLEAGVDYEFTFSYSGSSVIFPENMAVFMGDAQENGAMTTELITLEEITNDEFITVTIPVNVATSGSYYIGFHGYSDADMFYIAVDDLEMDIACTVEDAAFTFAADTLCMDDDAVTAVVTGTSGGVFSGTTGLDVDATTGEVDPATSTAGVHTLFYVTSTSECADTNEVVIVIEDCDLGMAENALAGVTVYPNPTNGLLHVNSPLENGTLDVSVIDFTGKEVFRMQNPVQGQFDIDLSNLGTGVYFVKFNAENAGQVLRIVLTK